MEPGYGYKAPPTHVGGVTRTPPAIPSASTSASASAAVRNIDGTVRAEILGNAQRRYEAAARELWIRTQAEVQAQVKALTHRQTRPLRSRGQVYRHAYYPTGHAKQWSPVAVPVPPTPDGPVVRAHDPVHVPPNGGDRPEYYPAQSPIPRPLTNVPHPSPSTTTNPMYYRFHPVPKQTGTSTENAEQGANKIYKEEDLKVDELKRRYYAQLSNQKYTQTGYNRGHMSATTGGYVPYSQGRSGTPVRSMADEYLDYYLPARRGPQSGSGYRRAERRSPEVIRHQQDGYADQQGGKPVPRHDAPAEARIRQRDDDVVQFQPPSRTAAESGGVRTQSSKSKLTFLLNPTEPREPERDPQSRSSRNRSDTSQCNCQKQNKKNGDSNSSLDSLSSERRTPRSIRYGDGETEHVTYGNRDEENRYRYHREEGEEEEQATPFSSKGKLDDEDGLLRIHRHMSTKESSPRPSCAVSCHSASVKRRLSPTLSTHSPRQDENEVPPRVKRRMLPEEKEEDGLSERIPVVAPSGSWDEPRRRSRLRHKTCTSNWKRGVEFTDDDDDDDDDDEMSDSVDRHDSRLSGSCGRGDGSDDMHVLSRKYDFRPRTKANSR